jgi:hypothetical protein
MKKILIGLIIGFSLTGLVMADSPAWVELIKNDISLIKSYVLNISNQFIEHVITIDYAHERIHDGEAYKAIYKITSLNDATTANMLFVPLRADKQYHVVVDFGLNADADYFIYSNPTLSSSGRRRA